MVIERDNFEGGSKGACKSEVAPGCVARPAQFKRVYLTELGAAGPFTFPSVTIEKVAVIDGRHVMAGNDSNLRFRAGRHVDRAGASELILLDVDDLLQKR